ncbi:hypothetical protein Syun_031289 [Stephania yunnanensis]|uniref:Uncharacterized protein n=1 Tax=Stephania yunnanensis TaxID=152371 RepID=A0AAP0E0C5_9MAGN
MFTERKKKKKMISSLFICLHAGRERSFMNETPIKIWVFLDLVEKDMKQINALFREE